MCNEFMEKYARKCYLAFFKINDLEIKLLSFLSFGREAQRNIVPIEVH